MAVPGWVVNLGAKLSGAGKVLTWLNGKKSYLAGAGLVLAGAAGLLTEAAAVTDAASALEFGKQLLTDPNWQKLLEGLGVLGLRHAVAKTTP